VQFNVLAERRVSLQPLASRFLPSEHLGRGRVKEKVIGGGGARAKEKDLEGRAVKATGRGA
jgi:hypothetical protein